MPRIRAAVLVQQDGGEAFRRPRSAASLVAAVTFLLAATGYGQQSSLLAQSPQPSASRLTGEGPALALGKYVASIQEPDPFVDSGPIALEIEASLPGLAEHGTMLAIRQPASASEHGKYKVIRFDGDATVKQQVIVRYLDAEEQAQALPHATVAVTPANYKFRYMGSMDTGGTAAYGFQISPKKKRVGLIQGQIWIDAATGIAVRQSGRFVKPPSVFIRRVEVRRDMSLRDGLPYTRVTHVAIDTRLVGRAELTITERPWETDDRQVAQQIAVGGGLR